MKKYSITFSLMFVLISSLMAVESDQESVNEKFKFIKDIYSESWALIIGINKYQNVDPLSYAVNDAKKIKSILIEKYGFYEDNIRFLTDKEATKDNIMNAFNDILLTAGEKDRVVVFYAGHGDTFKLPNGGDMGYLIPVDGSNAKEKIYLTSIPMSDFEQIAKMSSAKHILYLVDACYGGLSLNTRGLSKEQTPSYLKKMTDKKGRQVITAGGKDEEVMEKAEWGHSAFTKSLIAGLEEDLADANEDGIISGDELGSYIKNGVSFDTEGQHTPQRGRLTSDPGEFVFISKTLENEVDRVNADGGEEMDDIKQQMAAQQKQMAQLTELLLAQAQNQQAPKTQEVEPVGNYPSPVPKSKKSKKSFNMKTASALSWVFPGMGHYYSGRTGKGLLFTSLELISIAAIPYYSDIYNGSEENYQEALDNMQEVTNGNQTACEDNSNSLECYQYWKSEAEIKLERKNAAQVGRIAACTAAVGIWLWNTRDVKKNRSSDYSQSSKFSVGVNRFGQVEARINF